MWSNACTIPADTPVPGQDKLKMRLQGTKLTIQINGGSVGIPDYTENDERKTWTSEACVETIHDIEIGQGVTDIGAHAFEGLTEITTVTIPEHMAGKIGDYAFAGCTKLTAIKTGNSFTSVGTKAFFGCSALTDIELMAVQSIGDSAFEGCKLLKAASLSHATKVGSRAFLDCAKIETISMPESGTIGDSAFEGCLSLATVSTSKVTAIGRRTFFGCAKLTTADIQEVVIIPESAFEGCSVLATITMTKATEYGARAFFGCREASDISLATVKKVGAAALAGTGISFIDIPVSDDIKYVPESLFEGCYRMRTITFAPGCKVEEIKAKAFAASALDSIEIPALVTKIGDDCFKNCEQLNSVTYKGTTEISNSIFEGCTQLKPSELHLEAGYASLNFGGLSVCQVSGKVGELEYTVQRGSNTLELEGAPLPDYEQGKPKPWDKCIQFITTVDIREKVTSIGAYSFENVQTLRTVNFPDDLKIIGGNAFTGCTSLESIPKVPSTITEIGDSAFSGCKSLQSFATPAGLKKIGNFVFDGCSSAKTISIPASVSEIGEASFRGCSSLSAMDIPFSVTKITKSLFEGCSQLNRLTFASKPQASAGGEEAQGLTTIEERALYGCSALTSINLPATLTTIGVSAFEKSGVASIIFPNGVTSIGENALRNCESLTEVAIPEDVTTITKSLFEGCTRLSKISFGEGKDGSVFLADSGITTIEDRAFYGCASLQSITLPVTLVSIGVSAFEKTGLVSVVIPANVTTIRKDCFKDCKSLREVEYKGTTKISEDIFSGSNPTIRVPETYPSKDFGGDTVSEGGKNNGLSGGAIAGIVIAVLVVVAVIIVIVVLVMKRRPAHSTPSA